MYRLKSGEQGVIQALGSSFGSATGLPFILLDQDDRSGASVGGENMFFKRPELIDFAVVFAFIYEGVPNWRGTDATVVLQQKGSPDIEIRIDNPDSRDRFCVLASLSGKSGSWRVRREDRFFPATGRWISITTLGSAGWPDESKRKRRRRSQCAVRSGPGRTSESSTQPRAAVSKIEVMEYQKLLGSTNTSAAMDLYFYGKAEYARPPGGGVYQQRYGDGGAGGHELFSGEPEMVSSVNAGNALGRLFSGAVTGEAMTSPVPGAPVCWCWSPPSTTFWFSSWTGKIIVDKGMFYCLGRRDRQGRGPAQYFLPLWPAARGFSRSPCRLRTGGAGVSRPLLRDRYYRTE